MNLFRRPIKRARDGRYDVRLSDEERALVAGLAGELREMLVADSDDEGLRRLFPPGYANDAERDAEYQALVRDELLDKRLAAIDTLETTARATSLTEEEIDAWMGSINDLRLVLGTRLDVSEEMDAVPPDDPRAPGLSLYHYLTYLLAQLIHARAG